jgi:hypothetical protein
VRPFDKYTLTRNFFPARGAQVHSLNDPEQVLAQSLPLMGFGHLVAYCSVGWT